MVRKIRQNTGFHGHVQDALLKPLRVVFGAFAEAFDGIPSIASISKTVAGNEISGFLEDFVVGRSGMSRSKGRHQRESADDIPGTDPITVVADTRRIRLVITSRGRR